MKTITGARPHGEKTMKTTRLNGFDRAVILTAGMHGTNGKQMFGVFASVDDARSDDPDSAAMAIVGAETLSAEQLAIAEANSEELAGEL